jgi:hypothetical protein
MSLEICISIVLCFSTAREVKDDAYILRLPMSDTVFMQIVGKAWQCNDNWTNAVRYSMACVFHDDEF